MEKKLNETLQESAFGGVVNPILSRYPALTPAILSFGFKMTQDANPALPEKIPLPYAIHFRFGVSLATVYDMEFAFPFSIHNTDDHYFDNVLKAIDCVVTHSETSAHGKSSLVTHHCYNFVCL